MTDAVSDRAAARQAALAREIKNQGQSRGGKRPSIFISDDDLPKLGIGKFIAACGDKGAARDHFLHWLPPHPDDGALIALRLHVHYNVGSNEGAYICPRMMKDVFTEYGIPVPEIIRDGRCPICEKWTALRAELKSARAANPTAKFTVQEAEIKACSWGVRYLAWVVEATSPEAEAKGVCYFPAPNSVYNGVLDVSRDRRTNKITDITDPDTGRVLVFTRIGAGQFDTEYKAFSTEARDPIPDAWLDKVPRYTDVLNLVDYDTIREAFMGTPPPSADAPPANPTPASAPGEIRQGVADGMSRRRDRSAAAATAPAATRRTRETPPDAGVDAPVDAPVDDESHIPFDDAGTEGQAAPAETTQAPPTQTRRERTTAPATTSPAEPVAPAADAAPTGLAAVRARLAARLAQPSPTTPPAA